MQGALTPTMLVASYRKGNAADAHSPPRPAGLQGVAVVCCVAPRQRWLRHRLLFAPCFHL